MNRAKKCRRKQCVDFEKRHSELVHGLHMLSMIAWRGTLKIEPYDFKMLLQWRQGEKWVSCGVDAVDGIEALAIQLARGKLDPSKL